MKCLDKKRIKLKRGEALALNERHMLHMVSSYSGEVTVILEFLRPTDARSTDTNSLLGKAAAFSDHARSYANANDQRS